MSTLSYLFKYRGRRIRPKDKNLVYRFFCLCLFPLNFLVLIIFYQSKISKLNFENLSLSQLNTDFIKQINGPYMIVILLTSASISLLAVFLYFHFFIDHYKQLTHRQKIAQMFLANKWYES